ncbi:hypothetical protein SODALDRAFT_139019 [Sodiomyces alkalinus F11]|uniref:Uncharacterized protein n=1 Tax=Sodiomyces alkalinus (strain CBS 110278 / VKM F-3762 / F11) TaxID=1314773 RepID=A0A3N2PZA2_SODAK|nr:hypothetical protein SODALDRAFT_139019 [Sodiomyces alkalinus F11]ROT39834.1 hypothetical protein SODALDRAFT_139019 [Sodiomyces alkalinus F11]
MGKKSPKKDRFVVSKAEAAAILGKHLGNVGSGQDASTPSIEVKRLRKRERMELNRETTELVESRNALASELANWADRSAFTPPSLMSQSAELHLREMRHLQKLTKKLGEAELFYRIHPGSKENNAWDFIRNLAAQFRTHLGPRLGDGLSHDEKTTCTSGPESDLDDLGINEAGLAENDGQTPIKNQDAKRKRMNDSEVPSKKSKLVSNASASTPEMDEHPSAHVQSEISSPMTTEPSIPQDIDSSNLGAGAAGNSEIEDAGDGSHEEQKATKKKKKKHGKKERKARKKKSKKKKATAILNTAGGSREVGSDVEMKGADNDHRDGDQENDKMAKGQGDNEQLKSGHEESRTENGSTASSVGFQRKSMTAIPVPDYGRSSPFTASTPVKLPPWIKDPSAFSGGNRRWDPYPRPYHAPLFSSKVRGRQAETIIEPSTPSGSPTRNEDKHVAKTGGKSSVTMAIGPIDDLHIDNGEMTSPIETHVKNRKKGGRPKGSKANGKDAGMSTPQGAYATAEGLVRPLTPSTRVIDKFAIDSQDAERKRAKLQGLLRRDYEVLSQERKEWFRAMNLDIR